MLTTALLLILAATWFYASGRLLLAFLPPGWPGWAPGMGTREFGATVGVSWLLASTLYWALGSLTNLLLVGAEGGEAATILTGYTWVYFGLHAVLLVASLLRAPAKLRPRHELAPAPADFASPILAFAAVVLAAIPAAYRLDEIRADVGASAMLTSTQAALFFLGAVPGGLVPLALALVLVGALERLSIARWAAWLVGLGGLVAGFLLTSDMLRPHLALNRLEPGPRELQTFVVACVLGLVWARTADRRARAIALLLLALLPLAANVGVTMTALVGLCIVRFAMPSGGSLRWPWFLWVACTLTPIVHDYLMTSDVWEHGDVTITFHASRLAFPDFDHWRWWLTPPTAVLIWCWTRSRTPANADVRRLVRVAWALVVLAPVLLALLASMKGALRFEGTSGFSLANGEQLVTLRYFVLGWTPSLLLLVAVLFAPRDARGSTTDDPST